MGYKITVSNSTAEEYDLPLRVKYKDDTYIQHFVIPAYALNNELEFNNEQDYNAWQKQHAVYFKEKITIGKTTGHKMEKINADINIETDKRIESDGKSIDNLDEIAGVETAIESTGKKVKK